MDRSSRSRTTMGEAAHKTDVAREDASQTAKPLEKPLPKPLPVPVCIAVVVTLSVALWALIFFCLSSFR